MSWEDIEQVVEEERTEESHRKLSRVDPIGSAAETDVLCQRVEARRRTGALLP
jgi:hypothetical protein